MLTKLKMIFDDISHISEKQKLTQYMIVLYSFAISFFIYRFFETVFSTDSKLVFLISMLAFILLVRIFYKYPKFGFVFGVLLSFILSLIYSALAYDTYGFFGAISKFIILMVIFIYINFKLGEG